MEFSFSRENLDVALGLLGQIPFRLGGGRQDDAQRVLVGRATDPADALVELVGAVADVVGAAVGVHLHTVSPTIFVGQVVYAEDDLRVEDQVGS